MRYWDTSTLIKLYAEEENSSLFKAHAATSREPLIVAGITRLELWVALRRKEADGFLAAASARTSLERFDRHVARGNISVVNLNPSVAAAFVTLTEKCFSQNPPLFVRTFDMLHLASAEVAGVGEFVTTDRRLRQAASLAGFTLFPQTSTQSQTP